MSVGGLSKARLGRMHDVMAGHVERGAVPGLVTLLSRRGEVHVDAIGATALGGPDPIGRDTIFRISSLTKPITAAATMILVEECTLRLDEPVDRLLPELAGRPRSRTAARGWSRPSTTTWPSARDAGQGTARQRAHPVQAVGRDHDHRPAHAGAKAASGFFPGYFDSRGWGFGVCVITRRDDVAAVPGRFGWDGGSGTSWYCDPAEDMVAILMTQRSAFPLHSAVYLDFWTSAYQAIDD